MIQANTPKPDMSHIDYSDAGAVLSGREDLCSHLKGFQQRRAGFSFTLDGFIEHHDVALTNWGMRDNEGVAVVEGYDMLHFDQAGRISSVTGFSGAAAKKQD